MQKSLKARLEELLNKNPAEVPHLPTAEVQEVLRGLWKEQFEADERQIDQSGYDSKDSIEILRDNYQKLEKTFALYDLEAREEQNSYLPSSEKNLDIPYALDWEGNVLSIGHQIEQYGFEQPQVLNENFLKFVFPEDRAKGDANFKKMIEEGVYIPWQFRIRSPDGGIHWFEERSNIERNTNGEIVGIIGVLRDITKRKICREYFCRNLQHLKYFEASVNEGPAIICRWRLEPGVWPVELISDNIQQFGYYSEDFKPGGFRWKDLVHPEDSRWLEEKVDKLLQKGVREFSHEYRILTCNGEERWIQGRNICITDNRDNPTHIQGVILDITEQKRTAQKLKENRERYRRLFENEMEGIVMYDPESRRFVDVNKAALQMYGYTRNEFLKLRMEDITAEPKATEQAIKKVMNKGTHERIPLRWHRRKDGTTFPVEISPSILKIEGKIFLCGIIRNITARICAENSLKNSEARFRNLVEQTPNMVFIMQNNHLVYTNPSCRKLLGYSRSELFSRVFDPMTLVAPDCKEHARKRYELEKQGQEQPQCELALITKNGDRLEVVVSNRIIEYNDGTAILSVVMDITARKEAEKQIIQQRERLRELAAGLANAQDKEQRRISQGLHDDVGQLIAACNTRLSYAKQYAETDELKSIHEEIGEFLDEMDKAIRDLNFELTTSTLYRLGLEEAAKELCQYFEDRYGLHFNLYVQGEKVKLEDNIETVVFKAMRELMFNVVKHAEVKNADVFIAYGGTLLKITVKDKGKGFPQAENTDCLTEAKGLGLLNIRERLKDLNGNMQIISNQNKGAEISLEVPIKK
ncbi:MAG: PAS domain S-box protein [Candidatus Rifleibacteriota bacterium]